MPPARLPSGEAAVGTGAGPLGGASGEGGAETGVQAPCVQAFLPPLTFGGTLRRFLMPVTVCPGEGGCHSPGLGSSPHTARRPGEGQGVTPALGRPVGGGLGETPYQAKGAWGRRRAWDRKGRCDELRSRKAAPGPPSPCHPHLRMTPPSAGRPRAPTSKSPTCQASGLRPSHDPDDLGQPPTPRILAPSFHGQRQCN